MGLFQEFSTLRELPQVQWTHSASRLRWHYPSLYFYACARVPFQLSALVSQNRVFLMKEIIHAPAGFEWASFILYKTVCNHENRISALAQFAIS